jgi:hypothetical protein
VIGVGTAVSIRSNTFTLTEDEERELLRKLADRVALTQPDFWKELKEAR